MAQLGSAGPTELRGRVVLVDFWTLTCINWLRTEPYVRAWSQAYRNDGLVVIGVHTPEFSFEHELDLVRRATMERAIDYPVAIDNDYAIWRAFDNHHWPALYFVDRDGVIRDQHFGEGRYEQSERMIQRLLGIERELVPGVGLGVEAEADWDHLRTPETYLGYERGERFAQSGRTTYAECHFYELPEDLRLNQWALDGKWTIGPEQVVLNEAGGGIAYRFHARDARTSCCLEERPGRFPFKFSSTAKLPAARAASTSARMAMACSRMAAFTSSCGKTGRFARGRSRSDSSNQGPRHTRSPSDESGGVYPPTGEAGVRPPSRGLSLAL
jgi:thiol-disulfide isomerase/thioredoxin